jgi:hypothetical protein
METKITIEYDEIKIIEDLAWACDGEYELGEVKGKEIEVKLNFVSPEDLDCFNDKYYKYRQGTLLLKEMSGQS